MSKTKQEFVKDISNYFTLWEKINKCNHKSDITKNTFQKLKSIAKSIVETDFIGNDECIAEKLLHSLGFNSWDELRRKTLIKKKVKFIFDCINITDSKYKGSFNALVESGEKIEYIGTYCEGKTLKNKFYDTLEELDMDRKYGNRKFNLEELLNHFYLYEDYGAGEDISEIYRSLLAHYDNIQQIREKYSKS